MMSSKQVIKIEKSCILLLFCAMVLAAPCLAETGPTFSSAITVDVNQNLTRLLKEEDTDSDNKITIDDKLISLGRGDKRFLIVDTNDLGYEVAGTYYLSNLLQQLTLLQQKGLSKAKLNPDRIFEDPVSRISRSIRQIYWDGLTRKIDADNIKAILKDTKTKTIDGHSYLYVPYKDDTAHNYFSNIAKSRPELKMKVVRLPEKISPAWVRSRDGYHGPLSLALERTADTGYRGTPFVVPGGRFNEMYGWDSYFICLGLLEDDRIELARAMVDNFVYEINNYGKILNANRSYYLTRSQPPFLTSMALAVYQHLPKDSQNKQWLKKAFHAAIKEYNDVWMGEKRLTEIGLSRYYGEGIGAPVEVEKGHFNQILKRYAKNFDMDAGKFEQAYRAGSINVPELDIYFTHDRAMRESGHDTTWRWDDRCADFVTVDLNSLLYKIEIDIARTIDKYFDGFLKLPDGRIEKSPAWYKRAEKRKRLFNQYLWDKDLGLFLDYDLIHKKRKPYITPVAFYPMWAGLATAEQAESIVNTALPALEEPGGLAASSRKSLPELSKDEKPRQWDWPYGWAPHQMLAWKGLTNYGRDKIAHRLIYRWLYTITKNAVDYNGTVPEKFDVVKRSHRVFAEYGNVGTEFDYITIEGFGWMNASYQSGLKLLPPQLKNNLKVLTAPF